MCDSQNLLKEPCAQDQQQYLYMYVLLSDSMKSLLSMGCIIMVFMYCDSMVTIDIMAQLG